MQYILIGLAIFLCSVIVIELAAFALKHSRTANRIKIRKRLRKYSHHESETESGDIIRKRVLSEIPFLNRMLCKIPFVHSFDLLIQQANSGWPLGFYVLLTLFIAIMSFFLTSIYTANTFLSILAGLLIGCCPYAYLKQLKKKRIQKFQHQLPEGLDLIARALRAGHAFTNGLKLAADEFHDPLGPELDETVDEINFGVSVSVALKNLARRIDCPELKYFVVAVILQRETGGNLAEIIESLARLIRERFKLQGKIRTLAAEGKLSAAVLTGLPFLIMLWLRISNPDYLNLLFTDSMGKTMVFFAAVMMILGIVAMKKMINIKV